MKRLEFKPLIEASPVQIQVLARDAELAPPLRLYAQAQAAYLMGYVAELRSLMRTESFRSAPKDLQALIELRLGVREKTLTASDIERMESLPIEGVLAAELAFVSALAWEQLGNDERCRIGFIRAAALYRKHDCPKKALRSFYNSIAAESRVVPYKNFVQEYETVIEMSRELGDLAFAGVAQSMIAREYQILGLMDRALELATESVHNLQSETGSLHHGRALLLLAHLRFQVGNIEEAKKLLKESELSAFSEIRAIRKLLEFAMGESKSWDPELERELIPTWRERIPELLSQPEIESSQMNLGQMELRLLKQIWSGPVAKWDLIASLYPEVRDSEVSENRFKNLLGRVRKKRPELIGSQDGKYYIAKRNQVDLCDLLRASP